MQVNIANAKRAPGCLPGLAAIAVDSDGLLSLYIWERNLIGRINATNTSPFEDNLLDIQPHSIPPIIYLPAYLSPVAPGTPPNAILETDLCACSKREDTPAKLDRPTTIGDGGTTSSSSPLPCCCCCCCCCPSIVVLVIMLWKLLLLLPLLLWLFWYFLLSEDGWSPANCALACFLGRWSTRIGLQYHCRTLLH